jgi:hypothetical protein
VSSNDPAHPTIQLTLEVEVIVDVAVEPRALHFGELRKTDKESKKFSVKVDEPDRVKITSVKVEDEEHFDVTRKGSDGAGSADYELTFKGAERLGRVSTKVVVAYNAPEAASTELPITLTVVGDVRIQPTRLYFSKSQDRFKPRELTLTSRSGQGVEVLSVDDKGGLLKVETLTAKGEKAVLRLSVTDPDRQYDKKASYDLIVKTTDADSAEIVVPYSIFERPTRGGITREGVSKLRKARGQLPPKDDPTVH